MIAGTAYAQGDDWQQYVSVSSTPFDKAVKIESRPVRDPASDVMLGGVKTVQLFSYVDKASGEVAHMLLLSDRFVGKGWALLAVGREQPGAGA